MIEDNIIRSLVGTSVLSTVKVKWYRYMLGVAQRVGRGVVLPFHDRGIRRGWVVKSTPRPHFAPGKDTVPIVQEDVWAPGPVWTGGIFRSHRDFFIWTHYSTCHLQSTEWEVFHFSSVSYTTSVICELYSNWSYNTTRYCPVGSDIPSYKDPHLSSPIVYRISCHSLHICHCHSTFGIRT